MAYFQFVLLLVSFLISYGSEQCLDRGGVICFCDAEVVRCRIAWKTEQDYGMLLEDVFKDKTEVHLDGPGWDDVISQFPELVSSKEDVSLNGKQLQVSFKKLLSN